jgi:hypothetical protein
MDASGRSNCLCATVKGCERNDPQLHPLVVGIALSDEAVGLMKEGRITI